MFDEFSDYNPDWHESGFDPYHLFDDDTPEPLLKRLKRRYSLWKKAIKNVLYRLRQKAKQDPSDYIPF